MKHVWRMALLALALVPAGLHAEIGGVAHQFAQQRNALLAAPTREAQADLVGPYVDRAGLDAVPDLSLLMGEVSASADRGDALLEGELCWQARRLGDWADDAFYGVAASAESTEEQKLGAISCLRCIGFPAVPSLRAALALEVPTSGLAASVLAELFEPQLQLIEPMESALRKLVASRRSQDCGDVASAMSSYLRLFRGMGRVPAADLLAELLRDRCEFVRQDALAAIGSQAKSRCDARPLVEQMATRDPSGAARSAARTALRSAACVQ